MAFQLCCCWTSCWIVLFLLRNISTESPRYVLHHTSLTFDHAAEACSPGVLTTIATNQEVKEVLELISSSALLQDESTLWVGLKKFSNDCVVPALPLRGFRWTESGSQESQVSLWAEEPTPTCTAVRCAALKWQFDGSTVTWGLIPIRCKNRFQFICKLKDGHMGSPSVGGHVTIRPAILEPQSVTPGLSKPGPLETRPAQPKPVTQEPAETELKATIGPDSGSGPGPVSGSDSCQQPNITRNRWYHLDPDSSRRIRVKCWTSFQLDLFCSGQPAVWRAVDGSPANLSAICVPCAAGFQKDASGHCVDIDECNAAPCRHRCLNSEGSYRCVCPDDDGKLHDEDSPQCENTVMVKDSGSLSGILIPVLVAMAVLVVLVVVVVVTVKCCLMRRSKKRAMKKVEKMAMKSKHGKDSFETANEKAAI